MKIYIVRIEYIHGCVLSYEYCIKGVFLDRDNAESFRQSQERILQRRYSGENKTTVVIDEHETLDG